MDNLPKNILAFLVGALFLSFLFLLQRLGPAMVFGGRSGLLALLLGGIGGLVVCRLLDVRQKKRDQLLTEDSIKKSEKNFRELVENSQAGILLIQNNTIVYRNPEQKKLFGPLPASFRPDTFPGVHPDDREKLIDSYRKIVDGRLPSVDLDFRFYPRERDGGQAAMKWVFCRARRLEYQGKETVLVSMLDMTRSKELEQMLRIQDKMSSLGRVAAGIAHEVRNPLSGINIYLNTLAKLIERGDKLHQAGEIIEQAQAASASVEAVIRRVMDFAKPGQSQMVAVELNQIVEDALALSAVTLRKNKVELFRELAEGLPRCRVDSNQIEQVLLNLLTNAMEAMKDSSTPKILIATGFEEEMLVIRLADSGPGVPESVGDRIFDPFYTTKPDGTGIGLSLCQRIVNDHRGHLLVRKSAWGGAEFVVSLPVMPASTNQT